MRFGCLWSALFYEEKGVGYGGRWKRRENVYGSVVDARWRFSDLSGGENMLLRPESIDPSDDSNSRENRYSAFPPGPTQKTLTHYQLWNITQPKAREAIAKCWSPDSSVQALMRILKAIAQKMNFSSHHEMGQTWAMHAPPPHGPSVTTELVFGGSADKDTGKVWREVICYILCTAPYPASLISSLRHLYTTLLFYSSVILIWFAPCSHISFSYPRHHHVYWRTGSCGARLSSWHRKEGPRWSTREKGSTGAISSSFSLSLCLLFLAFSYSHTHSLSEENIFPRNHAGASLERVQECE